MPKNLIRRWYGLHHVWTLILMTAMTLALAWYEWVLGLIGFVLTGAMAVYAMLAERAFRRELKRYLGSLRYRIGKIGGEVIHELPFGILLFSDEQIVEWHNPYVAGILNRDSAVGLPLTELFPVLGGKDRDKAGEFEAMIGERVYKLNFNPEKRLVYVFDMTDHWNLQRKYEDEQLALGVVLMDNLEEVTQGMDDQHRAALLSKVTAEITDWSQRYQMYLRRLNSDRFLIVTDMKTLKQLEASRFVILDEVREMTMDQKIPMTLSIGMASGGSNVVEVGQWVQAALDIALGRGGDQAAVRVGQRQTFYGGKTNAVEKRTRVRARVVAHALRDLMKDSANIVIMGHKTPDMDSIGAAIGVLKAAEALNKEAYIVVEGVNPSIQKMMDLIREEPALHERFISPEHALGLIGPRSLAVVVDTHRESLLKEPRLLAETERIVIIDHHRRSEEFIANPVLVYMEPYASSTCELVTELLQYIHDRILLETIEATALMAGMTVDTKNFTLRTGARTFEAASYLRRNGADLALIQRMLKEDLDEYNKKAEIIRHAVIHYDHVAIAAAEPGKQYPQLLIAQAADKLLNMNGVLASFVVAERPDGMIGISARSLGSMNVQVVMERMGGGGHLTNAAAQMEGTVSEAAARLKAILDEIDKEEGLFE